MRKFFFLPLFSVLVMNTSCSERACNDLSQEAEAWTPLPTETVRFFPTLGRNVVTFSVSDIRREPTSLYNCYEVEAFFEQDTIFNRYLRSFSYSISTVGEEAKIRFVFYPSDPAFTGIPSGDLQEIGCVSVSSGMPCFSQDVESNFIGEKTINGIVHQNVVEIIDKRSGRQTGVLIERFYVNSKGILMINFEDGETWLRVF